MTLTIDLERKHPRIGVIYTKKIESKKNKIKARLKHKNKDDLAL